MMMILSTFIFQWYYDTTSPWTLDYPPFFAWFEYILSLVAQYIDPKMLEISATPYLSYSTLLFQRASVIISDIVLCYACSAATKLVTSANKRLDDFTVKLLLTTCYMCCAGLLIVDHIHFQYNGFLSGVFLLSLVNVIQGNIVWGGFYFSVLLNLKHIYLYVAPVYFVYMLRIHLYKDNMFLGIDILGLCKLGCCVFGVFAASFGPFLSHIPQILSRLFPVQRGLCHAYWAPNLWALYNVLDISCSKAIQLLGIMPKSGVHPLMSGLVQQSDFLILPSITPTHCASLTLVLLTPILIKLFQQPSHDTFLKSVTGAALASYFCGYHVHEKAVLVILVPFALQVFSDVKSAECFFFLSVLGTYSLFPLLFEIREYLVKVIILLMVHTAMILFLRKVYPKFQLGKFEKFYLLGLIGHFIVAEVILPLMLPGFEFLPLLLYSSYCSLGVSYSLIRAYLSLLS